MLQTLRLKNFAVVEEAEINVSAGLTAVTGETGAGKSMLIDALGALVGGRVGVEVIRAGAEEALVEGVFTATPALKARLETAGIENAGDEVGVRRCISRSGRSRVHVNGSLVTVGGLQRLLGGLVEVAGQHEHLALLDPAKHLGLLDTFAGLGGDEGPLTEHRANWARLGELDAQLEALGGDEGAVRARAELVRFHLEELERLAPRPGEDIELESERRRLAGGERLRSAAAGSEQLLSGDGGAIELVGRALQMVTEAERLDASLASQKQTLSASLAELDDAARSLSRYSDALDGDPRRLEAVEARLDALKRLCKKHVCTLEALVAKREALAAEEASLVNRGELRQALGSQRQAALARCEASAQRLSARRASGARALREAVCARLTKLAMRSAVFEVQLERRSLGADGADDVKLSFSANVGEPPKPLAKVASGGEASRLMLALRAALAGTDGVATVVFDEADAGVGGAVADVVGRLIRDVAGRCQVLCVTHLPQVAVHASAHLRLEKNESRGRTRSSVTALDAEGRTEELARMMSGLEVSHEALAAAAALLRSAKRAAFDSRRMKPELAG